MERMAARRSLSGIVVVMIVLAGLRIDLLWRSMRLDATGDLDDSLAQRSDHWRRTRRHVMRAVAEELRPASCHHRTQGAARRHAAGQSLREPLATRTIWGHGAAERG